ncbi:MAG: phosphatidylserine/phosphatidylglycerophosphate/cardiolipin synthase family protein [Hyphomicrobiaceae bacterium]
MPVVTPEYWFLGPDQTRRKPAFTRGNAATALIDGMSYMADLHAELARCDGALLIAGWRTSNEQRLDPRIGADGGLHGERLDDAVTAAAKRGCKVKALLFNVPGTQAPGPFRFWHAKENYEFARMVQAAGGEAILDSRLAPVPASAHHQKFVVAVSKEVERNVAYVGGIDVCLDRWDRPAHDAAAERQQDVVRSAGIETHTPSQPGWHDVQVRIQGPAVTQIWQVFQSRWNDPRPANHHPLLAAFRGGSTLEGPPPVCPPAGSQAVQVNQTLPAGAFPRPGGPGEMTVARAHEHAIDQAQHYIYVEDQYVWPCSLVERLERALERGVHVLMVVARDYDAPGLAGVAKRLRHEVFARLHKAGGERFQMLHIERDDGKQVYVHSKVLIVDDCYASIGSANFNARSLTNDTELQIGVVDETLVETAIDGAPLKVCRFAHELRCALWAEHLEQPVEAVRDPIAALRELWGKAPIAPSRRAHRHDASLSIFNLDPIAEYVTTLITERMAHLPLVPLPPGVNERSVVKLAVDAMLRGPQAALLMKAVEELLNPDLAPSVANLRNAVAAAIRPDSVPADPEDALGAQIIALLRRGKLPQMVDWFDPGLLVKIGIRDMISGTIGQYADQRLMQAASDHPASERELALRYDYANLYDPDPARRLATDEKGRVWIDYIADLGDGFEATYAMAFLMARETLEVADARAPKERHALPAGQILVMGGDQAYPQATQQEYQARLVDPYSWAYTTDQPARKLFAIPGNHDWYDGLNAFSSLFTSARDRISGGIGKHLGAWRCHQHRSYWALKLPYDWWIWGPDIQLEGNLDDPQRDYFDIVSDHTRPGDKIIICLAEPSWHHENYDNLHEISMLARKRGAKVCAVLAGDWHHYSRYTNPELGVQFITCGGGGAFAHATHQLKPRLDLQWAETTGEASRKADPADPTGFNRMEQATIKDRDHVDFSIKDYTVSVAEEPPAARGATRKAKSHSLAREVYDLVNYAYHTPRIYPSKAKSRLLALKNLLLPFRNVRFALLVGIIYFLYAWVFQVSAPALDPKSLLPAHKLSSETALASAGHAFWQVISPQRVMQAVRGSPIFFFMLLGLWVGLVYYVELGRGFLNTLGKLVIGTTHFAMHLTALLIVNLVAFLPTMLVAALEALLLRAGSATGGPSGAIGEATFLASYAVVSILMGGLVGAFIMGLYWSLTSILFNMHCGDAFGALGIKDYKHFLRMSFEPDRVTIYPVAIDKVPGRRGWRAATAEERAVTPSQIVPKKPLAPHLIEDPIVIKVADVK